MSKNICGIYCIECTINNKKYIGQSVNIKHRWRQHRHSLGYNSHNNIFLQRSWNKYGENNFKFYILEECDSTYLDEKEKYYIQKFKTTNVIWGYNLDGGGVKRINFKHTDETKAKISKIQQGRRLTEEWKNNISLAHKEKIKNGFVPKIENLDTARELQKVKIKCFDSNGNLIKVYDSIHSASNDLSILATNICKVLKGKNKTCGNFTFIYENDIISKNEIIKRFKFNYSNNRTVLKIDKNGNVLDKYKSISDCYNNQIDYDTYDSIKHQCTNRLKSKLDYKYIYERLYDKNSVKNYYAS